MKQKRRILVCIAACITFLAACAAFPFSVKAGLSENISDYAYWYSEQYQGYEIVKYKGTAARVKVPDSINGIPVTSIAEKSFWSSRVVEIVLPDSVVAIGEHAFWNCKRLRSVTLPKNLKTLGTGAFSSCERLKSVNLPDGLAELPDGAFYVCCRLEEIEIPKSVVRIGGSAFYYSGLKSITFAEGSALAEIEAGAFYNCFYLEEIRFPDSLEKIEQGAFFDCFRLKKAVFGENSKIETLRLDAFMGRDLLTAITIPKSVKEISVGHGWYKKITFQGKPPKGLNEICRSARKDAVIKTPAEYRAKYKRLLKKCKDYKKTMRIK